MDPGSAARGLLGGLLIGLAASLALLGHGRIAGISGTLGRLFTSQGREFRLPFLGGLLVVGVAGALLWPAAFGAPVSDTTTLAIAGLLVGVGTSLGNGCTSGHGVCGLSRRSPRSLVATLTFIVTGMLTVAIVGAWR
jgi:uncharacterized protein